MIMTGRGKKRKRQNPRDTACYYLDQNEDPAHLYVDWWPDKGRGIRSGAYVNKGDFLCSYGGQLRTAEEGDLLEQENETGFRFFFKNCGKEWCRDATEEPQSGALKMGRLVNHDRKNMNSKMKVIVHNDEPQLCLFAICNIGINEEILYDYGVSSLPWEKKQKCDNDLITCGKCKPANGVVMTSGTGNVHDDDELKSSANFDLSANDVMMTANNCDLPSTGGMVTSDNCDLPSTGGMVTSDNCDWPSTGGMVTSDNCDLLSTGGMVTSDNCDLPSTGGMVTSDNCDLPSTGGMVTSDNCDLPSTGGMVTSDNCDLPSTGEMVTSDNCNLPSTGGMVTSDNRDMSANDRQMKPGNNGMIMSDNFHLSSNDGVKTFGNCHLPVNGGVITSDNCDLPANGGVITSDNCHLSHNDAVMASDNCKLPAYGGVVMPDNCVLPANDGVITSDNCDLPANVEMTTTEICDLPANDAVTTFDDCDLAANSEMMTSDKCHVHANWGETTSCKLDEHSNDRVMMSDNCDIPANDGMMMSDNCDIPANDGVMMSVNCDISAKERVMMSDSHDIPANDRVMMSDNCDIPANDKVMVSDNCDISAKERVMMSDNCDMPVNDGVMMSVNCDISANDRMTMADNCDIPVYDGTMMSDNFDKSAYDGVLTTDKCDLSVGVGLKRSQDRDCASYYTEKRHERPYLLVDGGMMSSDKCDLADGFEEIACSSRTDIEVVSLMMAYSYSSDSSVCANRTLKRKTKCLVYSDTESFVSPSSDELSDTIPIVDTVALKKNRTGNAKKGKSISVLTCNNTNDRRVWDRTNTCLFCNGQYSKLPRHFEQVHGSEFEIAEALSHPTGSKQRTLKWKELINRGNFNHNRKVLESGHGTIIPSRRPTAETDVTPSDFLPCQHCFAFLRRKELWRHVKGCKQKAPNETSTRTRHQSSSAALLPASKEAGTVFKAIILDNMANDDVTLASRNDDLIVSFGLKLFAKCTDKVHQYTYLRTKLRELGRLLLNLRKVNKNVKGLADIIKPTAFRDVVESVKLTCGYNQHTFAFETPTLALKLGHSLKKCAETLRAAASIKGDHLMKQDASDFIELYQSEWTTAVSSQALQTLSSRKYSNPKRIPWAEDIRKLNLYLETKAGDLCTSLKLSPSADTWRKLAEVCLSQVVIFNRRRGGETERMTVSQYNDGVNTVSDLQEEVAASLSRFEKELAKTMTRIEIRGKRGRRVAVLLPQSLRYSLDLLLRHRCISGIGQENNYFFGRIGNSQTPIRSCDVLKKFAIACGAKEPDLLTSTSLRKHIATVSQILNLQSNELDVLANFLGHDVRVHREFYRLPENTLQVSKISKLLMGLDKGNFQSFKGQTLDEIDNQDEQNDNTECPDVPDKDDETTVTAECVPSESQLQSHKCKGRQNGHHTRKSTQRRQWSPEEKAAVQRQLGQFFQSKRLPGKLACDMARQKEPALRHRPWKQIKYFIKNHK